MFDIFIFLYELFNTEEEAQTEDFFLEPPTMISKDSTEEI